MASNKMNSSDNDQEAQEEEAKCKQRNRGKKRKRVSSESSTDIEDVLPENTLEVEKNLQASAIKNNLDDVSVKKILKKVVTNDHVLALVKLRAEEEESSTEENLQPKITRAKAKELMKVSPKSTPWNLRVELSPIKHIPVKTRPEVKALIAQELPDDEDDEEYEPTNDDVPSDDDHVLESSSDVDSLPRTPVTPRSLRKTSPKIVNDGPFKVPQQQELSTPARRKLVLEEEEPTIALRTRSKLSLSTTSIEHIESSFVPPDDLPMPDVDSLWKDFLKDCLNPASNARNEDDDEADPEYNVAADPDANDEDEESLENTIIKISQKELDDLISELFNVMPEGGSGQADNIVTENVVQDMLTEHTALQPDVTTRWEGKQEPDSGDEGAAAAPRPAPIAAKSERFSIGKCEQEHHEEEQPANEETHPENNIEQEAMDTSAPPAPVPEGPNVKVTQKQGKQPPGLLRGLAPKPQPIRIEIQKDACTILPEQLVLLEQQLRQHVQLATSSYLQLFVHPSHWARAPIYKEYLESLEKMSVKTPSSVVNVCNLKPALELIASWETAVSANTKENLEMVNFIRKEEERSRRRSTVNRTHVGDFPEMYLKVVSNSPVFLYPHLLPAMPFRPDFHTRRATYHKSEDHLITLGLDQFWEYVHSNPEIYKRPAYVHPRHRWGLAATVHLTCKHMMPWLPPKTLLAHVRHAKKGYDKDNPIYKFFQSRQVEPVRHRLLPYNAQLTLYEQPAHEVPRVWVRYLANTSARFKKFLYGRNKTDVVPSGVDIDINVQAPKKTPLPIDFNKKIHCSRMNLLPKQDEVPLVNRIDVAISTQSTSNPLVASQIFTVLNTSNGSFLVPLQMQTNTVNATITPLCATQEIVTETPPASHSTPDNVVTKDIEVEGTKTAERSNPNDGVSTEVTNENADHCSCCVQMRYICKPRKKTIVDYFKVVNKSEEAVCDCKGRQYPRITNRLKLLIRNYRTQSKCVFEELEHKIAGYMKDDDCEGNKTDSLISDDDENDLVTATLFQLKLTTMTGVTRNNLVKKRIHTLFSKFDFHTGDVVALAGSLAVLCEEELMEYYREFTGFLTAEQADVLGQFNDYFVQRCLGKLIGKIEELVPDKQKRCSMLWFLKSKLFTTAFRSMSACEICTQLLWVVDGSAPLARYVFGLFPHRRACSEQQQSVQSAPEPAAAEPPADTVTEPVEPDTAKVHEADHSEEDPESDEDNIENTEDTDENSDDEDTNENSDKVVQYVNKHESTPVKIEEEEIVDTSMTEVSNDASVVVDVQSDDTTDTSRLVMSEEDIKCECPEWKRDEDKVILEILKQHITTERGGKTVLEVLEETQALAMISDSLPHKSMVEVRGRIIYLLQLLVNGDLLQ